MDEKVFFCYLDYQKKSRSPIWKRILRLPIGVGVSLVIGVLSIVFAILTVSISAWREWQMVASAAEVISCVLLLVFTEKYQIKSSKENLSKYEIYCKDLMNWLNTYGFSEKAKVELLYKRISERIVIQEKEKKESSDRSEKWIQTFIIPIVLAVVSAIIANQKDLITMFASVFSIVFIFILIYSLYSVFRTAHWFPVKRKTEQMKRFAEDLRAILDFEELNRK